MIDFREMTRKFLAKEWKETPSIRSYFKTVANILESIKGRTQQERLRLSEAKHHLREVKKLVYKLEEKVHILEEQIKVLEESKGKEVIDD